MKSKVLWIALVLVAACSQDESAPGAAPPPPPAGAAAAAVCPATFEAFLTGFMASAEAQRAAVADIVRQSHVVQDTSDEGMSKVTTFEARGALAFPVMPLVQDHARQSLHHTTKPQPDGAMVVQFQRQDSDSFQVAYRFEKADCWRLTAIDDQSL